MNASPQREPFWKRPGSLPVLLAAAGAAVVLVLVVQPGKGDERIVENPAADAREAYIALLSRIDSTGAAPPPVGEAVGSGETLFAATGRSRLERDLFAPARAPGLPTLPVVPAPKPAVPRVRTPVVSAVFVGTGAPMAVVNGTAVGEGDEIDGYVVVRIVPDGVILDKDGSLIALRPGGKS